MPLLHKKLSRKFRQGSAEQQQSPVATLPTAKETKTVLPAVRPSSPLLTSSPLLSSPIKSPTKPFQRDHRRSRSFSAITTSVSLNDLSRLVKGNSTQPGHQRQCGGSQPWRSQDTWSRLHQHHTPPTLSRTPPTSLSPDHTAGWRSGGEGEGFFGKQVAVVRLHRRSEAEVYAKEVFAGRLAKEEAQEEWKTNGEGLLYRLKSRTGPPRTFNRSVTEPTPRLLPKRTGSEASPSSRSLMPSDTTSSGSSRSSSSSSSTSTIILCSDQDNEKTPTIDHNRTPSQLLPPLLPTRSSSMARSQGATPIPWGRRSPSERRSASPTLSKSLTPPRITINPPPSRALPPPPPMDVPSSPDPEHYEESIPSPVGSDRLDTPTTPPRRRLAEQPSPSVLGKNGDKQALGLGLGDRPRPQRVPLPSMPSVVTPTASIRSKSSRDTVGSKGSSRGGWI